MKNKIRVFIILGLLLPVIGYAGLQNSWQNSLVDVKRMWGLPEQAYARRPSENLSQAQGSSDPEPKKCRLEGTRVDLDGARVCLPNPSADLLRSGIAFEISEFSGKPFADAVNDLVQTLRAQQDHLLPTQVAPGTFPLRVASGQLSALNLRAPERNVISNVTITNQGPEKDVLVFATFTDGTMQSRLPPGERVALGGGGAIGEIVTVAVVSLTDGVVLIEAPAVQDAPPPPATPTCRLRRAVGFFAGDCIGSCVNPPNCVPVRRTPGFFGAFSEVTACGCR